MLRGGLGAWLCRQRLRLARIHVPSSTHVGAGVRIHAADARIGAHCFLGDGVEIAAPQMSIGDHCHIAEDVCMKAERIDLGENCIVFPGVRVLCLGEFRMGRHGKISRGAALKAGGLILGAEFWMNADAEVGGGGWRNPRSYFQTGDRCHVGRLTHVNVSEPVIFGDDTAVGMHCILATHAHWQPATRGYPRVRGPIRLGSDVAIYSRVVISPGISIGDGATVAAGAVVNRDVPALAFAAGVPARVVRENLPRAGSVSIAIDLLREFMATQHGDSLIQADTQSLVAELDAGKRRIVYTNDPSRVRSQSLASAIVVTLNPAVTAAAASAECVFDLEARTLSGTASACSESLRVFFFSAGLRFKYLGYRRDRLEYAQLIEWGIE
jgi:acetyltransferase-like isoleucine patch superfamily enzyme